MRLLVPFSGVLAVLILPYVLANEGGWNGQRSFSAELGSTLGISALGVLAILVLLPSRLRALARLGADAAVRLHRHLVGVLLALIVGHIVLAVVLQPARWGLGRFFGQPWRAQAAISSVVSLVALIAVSIWRRKLRIPYAAWRALHGGLAIATLVLAAGGWPPSAWPPSTPTAGTATSIPDGARSRSSCWSCCPSARWRRFACA